MFIYLYPRKYLLILNTFFLSVRTAQYIWNWKHLGWFGDYWPGQNVYNKDSRKTCHNRYPEHDVECPWYITVAPIDQRVSSRIPVVAVCKIREHAHATTTPQLEHIAAPANSMPQFDVYFVSYCREGM